MNAKYGGEKITCTQLDSVEDVLKTADIVSLHTVLDETTTGMIDKTALEMMKPDAVLVNSSRGPIINETDLVAHLQANPDFRCGARRLAMHPSRLRIPMLRYSCVAISLSCTCSISMTYSNHKWVAFTLQVWTFSKMSH